MSKIDNDIKVEFLGNSAIDVTGSCIRITFLGKTYLIECGSVQGYTLDKCYTLNKELVSQIKVDNLEAIWVMHCHQDHEGNLPAIVKKVGFHSKIYCTYETKKLSQLLLLDSAYIHEKDATYLSKKKKGKVSPLYREEDVIDCYNAMESCDRDKIYKINNNVSFKLLKNNHCLGASQLELYFRKPNNVIKKITYTSDLGSNIRNDKPFVSSIEYSTKNNLFIIEGTYGLKNRSYSKKDVKNERYDLKENIKTVINRKGKVLLPCFSFSRTQEVLVDLYNMFHDDINFGNTPIYIDSKLSVEITACYHEILKDENLDLINKVTQWKNVHMNKSIKGTFANLNSDEPAILLSSQGFISAGRSQLYAKNFLPNEKDGIFFVGYCPENSAGGRIINPKTKTVKIDTGTYHKKCMIKAYKTYSSHAQHDELLKYIKMVNTDKIIVHHSSKEAKQELIQEAKKALQEINKTTQIMGSSKHLELKL
ncbi:MAG: MBL fold metallo-hydrolase [Bacillota bacterium]|nr:MBL fold metallo-hydrolase [Bacillota bacterium]